jgi:hypothetical protein
MTGFGGVGIFRHCPSPFRHCQHGEAIQRPGGVTADWPQRPILVATSGIARIAMTDRSLPGFSLTVSAAQYGFQALGINRTSGPGFQLIRGRLDEFLFGPVGRCPPRNDEFVGCWDFFIANTLPSLRAERSNPEAGGGIKG